MIPLCLREIFEKVSDPSYPNLHEILISYIEIYNEAVNDLLDNKSGGLAMVESQVVGLSQFKVTSFQQAIEKFELGEQTRKYASTGSNTHSSRSHAIFRININSTAKGDMQKIYKAHIDLIDLAGSQGIQKTKAEGQVKKEGQNINKSLLTLSKVINILGQKTAFAPFRESKLTRILQKSLTGGSRVVVICNINPSVNNMAQTVNTLKFGVSAGHVKLTVKANELVQQYSVNSQYPDQQEYEDLVMAKEAEIQEITGEMKRISEHLEEKQSQNESLLKLVEEKDKEIKIIKGFLASSQSSNDIKQKQLENAYRQISKLKEKLETLQKVNTEKELVEEIHKTKEEIRKMEDIHYEMKKKIKALETIQQNQLNEIRQLRYTLEQNKSKHSKIQPKKPKQPLQVSYVNGTAVEIDPIKLQNALEMHLQVRQKNRQIADLNALLIEKDERISKLESIRLQYEIHQKQCPQVVDGRKSESNNNSRLDDEDVRAIRRKAGIYKKELSARKKREQKYALNLRHANQKIRDLQQKLHDKCVALEWIKQREKPQS